jgi:hypothetical protein
VLPLVCFHTHPAHASRVVDTRLARSVLWQLGLRGFVGKKEIDSMVSLLYTGDAAPAPCKHHARDATNVSCTRYKPTCTIKRATSLRVLVSLLRPDDPGPAPQPKAIAYPGVR